jgi:hypothetical protein
VTYRDVEAEIVAHPVNQVDLNHLLLSKLVLVEDLCDRTNSFRVDGRQADAFGGHSERLRTELSQGVFRNVCSSSHT